MSDERHFIPLYSSKCKLKELISSALFFKHLKVVSWSAVLISKATAVNLIGPYLFRVYAVIPHPEWPSSLTSEHVFVFFAVLDATKFQIIMNIQEYSHQGVGLNTFAGKF